jgi:serine/threonine protein phosphatase PrpC
MIKIKDQICVSEQGKRANNEDSALFSEGEVFIVCDGVGGNEKGEIASHIVAEVFLAEGLKKSELNLNEVLRNAENALSDYLESHPAAIGMATTLTFSKVLENGIQVAWCGDSRVYQFRNGEIVYQTRDHSWVNEAVDNGIITLEESINHPKSNVITRAVQGNHKSTQLDSHFIKDVRKGDFFMHCSDGILEAWSDDDLMALFNSNNDINDIATLLKQQCEIDSRDNFTAILYKIDEADISTNEEKATTENNPEFVIAIPIEKAEPEHAEKTQAFHAVDTKRTIQSNIVQSDKVHNSKGPVKTKVNWKGYLVALLIPCLLYSAYVYLFPSKVKAKVNSEQTKPSDSKINNGKLNYNSKPVEKDSIKKGNQLLPEDKTTEDGNDDEIIAGESKRRKISITNEGVVNNNEANKTATMNGNKKEEPPAKNAETKKVSDKPK